MRRYIHSHPRQANIGIIGAGQGGQSSINRLLKSNYYHADFILVDTDRRDLNRRHPGSEYITERILLSNKQLRTVSTHAGTDGDVELGKLATQGTITKLKSAIRRYDLLFLFGGMGGGTATAALPIIAEAAAELDILTIAIVTTPFEFEENRKHTIAHKGLAALNSLTDSLIPIHGDKLLKMVKDRVELDKAWAKADLLRHQCLHVIEEMTQHTGIINVDLAGVRAIIEGNGTALMTMGVGYGENRIDDAVRDALKCSILDRPVQGANNVLMYIVTSPNDDFIVLNDACNKIQTEIGSQTKLIWGVSEDTCLYDGIRILLVATGFPEMTQIGHINSPPMRKAVNEEQAEEKRERFSLANHFWTFLTRDPDQ